MLNASGWTLVLPFLDQQGLYDAYNFSQCGSGYKQGGNSGPLMGNPVANSTVTSTKVHVFMCPTDNGQPHLSDTASEYSISPALAAAGIYGQKTTYEFSAQPVSSGCFDWGNSSAATRRMFGENSNATEAGISDGLTKTVAVNHTTFNVYDGRTSAWGYRGWVQGAADLPTWGINNFSCCAWQSPPWAAGTVFGRLGEWGSAGSLHPGGTMGLMGDGSVQYISESTDMAILRSISYIADGSTKTLGL